MVSNLSATPHEIALNLAVWFFFIPLFFVCLGLIERFVEWRMNHADRRGLYISNYLHWKKTWVNYTITPFHHDKSARFLRVWIFCFEY